MDLSGLLHGQAFGAHVPLRYPEMFDGLISGAPALDYPGLVGTSMRWLIQAETQADEGGMLKLCKRTI